MDAKLKEKMDKLGYQFLYDDKYMSFKQINARAKDEFDFYQRNTIEFINKICQYKDPNRYENAACFVSMVIRENIKSGYGETLLETKRRWESTNHNYYYEITKYKMIFKKITKFMNTK